jgi:predicted nucleotidyltransferase
MIYLETKYLEIVKNILRENIPEYKVVVFGSRATGKQKVHSDLDLCVTGKEPLSLEKLANLREDFSESDLPIRVDIVDSTTVTPEFKKIIETSALPLEK